MRSIIRHLLAATLLWTGILSARADTGAVCDPWDDRSPLRQWDEEPLLVVAFLGPECPLARVYSRRLNALADAYRDRGVGFVAIDSNPHDDDTPVAGLAAALRFPLLRDAEQRLADALGATRSPQAFLLDRTRQVVYQGRIDDQYQPGLHGRTAPSRQDLDLAIRESLAMQPVTVPITEAVGCVIDRHTTGVGEDRHGDSARGVTYSRDVAAILDRHCVECHRAGAAGPFSLTTYDNAAAWSETIHEVVAQRRMPPWGVEQGDFVNDRSLSERERATLEAWLEAGTPAGDPAERPAPPTFRTDWSIRPDRILSMPKPFEVPAEGVLDYQEFAIDPGFAADTWVNAVEIRPGCREVVHHVNVYVKPKHAREDQLFVNSLGDYYLAMSVPGNTVMTMPPGTAKLVPAGWEIVLSVHYVPNGVEQRDQSSVALSLCDASTVRRELATRALLDDHLLIAPFERKQVTHSFTCEDDFTLFALYPHMHLRGRSMLFTAQYPDGRQETLLDVARYDFAWQYRYVLRTPKSLPRGTVVTATALYDNTVDNKNNPDPATSVRAGRQTSDEMFQACFEICRTHEDRLAGESRWSLVLAWLAIVVASAIGLGRVIIGTRKRPVEESRQTAALAAE